MVGLFFMKLADEIIGTIRSMFLIQNNHFWGAIFNMLKAFFGLLTIHALIMNPSIITILVMCLAVFIGTYFPAKIMDARHRRQVATV